jgi:predicted phage tail component-like protein
MVEMAIKFGGVDLPSFVIINDVKLSLLPPVNVTEVTVLGRTGTYDFGSTLGSRTITVKYTLEADSPSDLRVKARAWKDYLFSKEAKELVLLEEPDKYYLAKLVDDTDYDEIVKVAQGSVTLLCSDPYLYGAEKQVTPTFNENSAITVENGGGEDTYPIIEMEFTQPSTDIYLSNQPGEQLVIGQPENIEQPPVPKQVSILSDPCDSLTGWTQATTVDGGVIAGTFTANGQLRATNGDYGSGTAWHGPSMIKSLSKEIQDFDIQLFLTFDSAKPEQVGRVELYLLDKNNVQFGKIAMVDRNRTYESPTLEARAGQLSGGIEFVNTPVGTGSYADFYGRLRLRRIGQWWYFEVGRRDVVKDRYYGRWSAKYFDADSKVMNKLSVIQVHIGAIGTLPPVSSMGIEGVYIFEENPAPPEQVPQIFQPGDKLTIDMEKGEIWKNGYDSLLHEMDPATNFFPIHPGTNAITILPPVVNNVKVTFKERWL